MTPGASYRLTYQQRNRRRGEVPRPFFCFDPDEDSNYALPNRYTFVPHTGQVPEVAACPFFSFTC
jgi:hypothetical protein